jgi:hypothetical protein
MRVHTYTDVEFSDRDVEPEGGETLHVLLDVGRELADDEVALEADAVDEALLLQVLHDLVKRGRLVVDPLDVVVVLRTGKTAGQYGGYATCGARTMYSFALSFTERAVRNAVSMNDCPSWL